MTEVIQIVRWEGLTPNQQRVLTSAMEHQLLSMLYLLWEPDDDRAFNGGDNNRGRPYAAALIPAAVELIRLGMVGVEHRDPKLRILPEDEAIAAVGDIGNWWRYRVLPNLDDPFSSRPDDEAGVLTADELWISRYTLTQVNRDRFTISSWAWPPRMDSLTKAS